MTENLFFLNSNGQLEINFDSLELITDETFTNLIKTYIDRYSLTVYSVNDFETDVRVIMYDQYYNVQIQSYKKPNSPHVNTHFEYLHFKTIEELYKKLAGGKYNE